MSKRKEKEKRGWSTLKTDIKRKKERKKEDDRKLMSKERKEVERGG